MLRNTPEAIIVDLSIFVVEFERRNFIGLIDLIPNAIPNGHGTPVVKFRREEIEVAHQQCFKYSNGKLCLEQARKKLINHDPIWLKWPHEPTKMYLGIHPSTQVGTHHIIPQL
jgi:hypothetical protein